MILDELFDVIPGTATGIGEYGPGKIPLVSATFYKNGVWGFVASNATDTLFSGPCLVVAASAHTSTMFTTIHVEDFYATHHMAVLKPNKHKFWDGGHDMEKLAALAAYLRKSKWRYGRGRDGNARVKNCPIDLSVVLSILPQLTKPSFQPKMLTIADIQNVVAGMAPGTKVAQVFSSIVRGDLPTSMALPDGNIPFVSTTEQRINGVCGFVDSATPNFLVPGDTISVATNGKPLVSRVQRGQYVKNGDVASLVPLDQEKSPEKLAILAALIENQAWRYNYARKGNERLMKQVIIP